MHKEILPLNLLVVEDNAGDFVLLKNYLKHTLLPIGAIDWAKQLAEAEKVLSDKKIDLAFLDLTLPDSTGINSFITLNKLLPNTPIIVLSGLTDIKVALEAISQGAQDYLIKGEFNHHLLAKSIQYSVQRKKTLELEKELAEQQVNQQRLITEVTIRAQEKERDELGKELHDNVNQVLATIKMYVGMALNDEKQRGTLLTKTLEFSDYAIEEIRRLSKTLIAPSLGNRGLIEALQKMVDEQNFSGRILIDFTHEVDTENNIHKDVQLMLYRISQEQLNNIYKYSKADKAVIWLKTDFENVYLSISDDGIGFDPSQKAKGIGLQNISSRVSFYSGNIKIDSAPGKGCTLKLNVPLQKKEVTNV